MKKIPLIDNLFSHAYTSSWYNKSTIMEWDRTNIDSYDYIVTTDPNIETTKKKYFWLIESPEITKNYYDYAKNNNSKFEKIFTCDKNLLETINNSIFVPVGGCWVQEEDRNLYIDDKNKLLSMLSSDKNFTTGHRLRKEIINNFFGKFDLYGFTYNKVENKIDALKKYKFQIVVENCKQDYYFTEKIIDCFQTGVVPIYWGCPSINKFFDEEGIITFDGIKDLEIIINNLNDDLYISKIESVIKNFELSKEYLISEDYMIKKYFNESN